jgi:uncharacterized protein
MKGNKLYVLTATICCLLIIFISSGFFKADYPKPIGFVSDFENVFTKKEELSLTKKIKELNKETDVQIVLVTIDSTMTNKEEFDEYTLSLAQKWEVGEKVKNNGILIGISKSMRRIRIQNGLGIEKIISDAETKIIIDEYFIPSYKKEKYYDGTIKGLTELTKLIKSKPN